MMNYLGILHLVLVVQVHQVLRYLQAQVSQQVALNRCHLQHHLLVARSHKAADQHLPAALYH